MSYKHCIYRQDGLFISFISSDHHHSFDIGLHSFLPLHIKMRGSTSSAIAAVASIATVVQAATLADVCTTSYAVAALPAAGFYEGITIDSSSIAASPVYNTSVSGSSQFPDGTFDFCNGKWLHRV
jgi:hypothetical protein